ncbi:hypothetical protein LVJ94_25870 [Pendulispora rubella]|uniref:Uncharacterized protein n=1 Tax=Pendulispora rubella TaxID=2741070 RepID=A0ABZ2LI69_9BACT
MEPFDDRFWLTGAEPPLPLLDTSVRGALPAIVNHRPVLGVGYGLADLAWSGSWDEPVGPRAILKAGIDIVVACHRR